MRLVRLNQKSVENGGYVKLGGGGGIGGWIGGSRLYPNRTVDDDRLCSNASAARILLIRSYDRLNSPNMAD